MWFLVMLQICLKPPPMYFIGDPWTWPCKPYQSFEPYDGGAKTVPFPNEAACRTRLALIRQQGSVFVIAADCLKSPPAPTGVKLK